MNRTIHKTLEPVTLEGFQCIMKPSEKFHNYSLSAIVGDELRSALEEDRVEALKWATSKLKNPKRSTLKPEPWEEVAEGKYKVKFSWKEENKPPIVDTEGTPITDLDIPLFSGSKVKFSWKEENKPPIVDTEGTPITDLDIPLFSGSKVKLAFFQKPYIIAGDTYGTALKLVGVQVISTASSAGVDGDSMDEVEVAALFGATEGYKTGDRGYTDDSDDF